MLVCPDTVTIIENKENEIIPDIDITAGTSAVNILKRKKNEALKSEKNKKKKSNNEILKDITSSKTELNKLKQELLLQENIRNGELHKERLAGLQLDNEEKRLKITLLKLKIENYKKNV
ncbi:hypothetical protein FQR65_LT19836 [Abscondita terminalis]|nr:hypothetical protein FQR65_LT19836 [Abscondita terminalis]